MSKQNQKSKERVIGKSTPEKKPLIDPRYKSVINTTIFILVLVIFFIVNNTRDEPKSGPHPPGYKSASNIEQTK